MEKCVFSQQGKVHILAFLLSVPLPLHLFPALLASFSLSGVCVAHCSSSCPHVHYYFPPCSFFGVATTCVPVFADVRCNLFSPEGARPPLLHSKFISACREMRRRTYIFGGYAFVQKTRRNTVSNLDHDVFGKHVFGQKQGKAQFFWGAFLGKCVFSQKRKSAYFRNDFCLFVYSSLISHPVGLASLLRRWWRSLHYLPHCSSLLLRTHLSFLLLRTHILARGAPGSLACIKRGCCLPIPFLHTGKCT